LGKLANISGKNSANAFKNAEWEGRGQVGNHLVMTKASIRANLTIPQHAEVAQTRSEP
jgi:predicted RNA binding protein YcfA (HicA-like mRNA interferase family)